MGRPIKNKYINPAQAGYIAGDGGQRIRVNTGGGVGGEGITITNGNVAFGTITRGSGYFVSNVNATITAPDLVNGVPATLGTVYLFANGAIKDVRVTSAGSGYSLLPTISFFEANTGTATATANIDLSVTHANSIRANCFFPGTSAGITTADILKQRGSRSFVCANVSYSKTLRLITNTNGNLNPYVAGTMTITATFADASQFNIAKITDRLVTSATGQRYKWTLDPAGAANVTTSNITVSITSV